MGLSGTEPSRTVDVQGIILALSSPFGACPDFTIGGWEA